MIATLFVGILCVLISGLSSDRDGRLGLKFAFFVLFVFLAFRYDFGNDYQAYSEIFENTSIVSISDHEYFLLSFYEPGWLFVNWLFKCCGFSLMIAFLSAMNCYIYYKFISEHLPVKYYRLAVYLYVFYPGFMLIHASAMRQCVAIMLFVNSIKYIYNEKPVKYFAQCLIAVLFHYSAIVLFPVYLVKYFGGCHKVKFKILILFSFLFLFVFSSNIAPYVKDAVGGVSEKYSAYQDSGAVGSGLGFLYYSVLLSASLIYFNTNDARLLTLFKITVIAFMFVPTPLIVDMIGRLLMYFMPATIVIFPFIIKCIKNNLVKILFVLIVVVITLFQFFQFFSSDNYREGYWNYKTVFSAK